MDADLNVMAVIITQISRVQLVVVKTRRIPTRGEAVAREGRSIRLGITRNDVPSHAPAHARQTWRLLTDFSGN